MLYCLAGIVLLGWLGAGSGAAAQDQLVARQPGAPAVAGASPSSGPRLLIPNADVDQSGVIRLRPPGDGPLSSTRPPPAAPATGVAAPSLIPPVPTPGPVGSPPPHGPAKPLQAPTRAALVPPPEPVAKPAAAEPERALPRPAIERPERLYGTVPNGAVPLPTALGHPSPPPPAAEPVIALPANEGEILRIDFDPGTTLLTQAAKKTLSALAEEMATTDGRLQLEAFAGHDNAGKARRTSLTRALTVRAFLIEQGMSGTRVDVRASGVSHDGGSEDRVDVILRDR